jgi:hypothetical protein
MLMMAGRSSYVTFTALAARRASGSVSATTTPITCASGMSDKHSSDAPQQSHQISVVYIKQQYNIGKNTVLDGSCFCTLTRLIVLCSAHAPALHT